MSECPAAFMHLKPKPFILVNDKPAGAAILQKGDSFRSCTVIPNGALMVYKTAKRWNEARSKFYSSVPWPILGEPFDTSKPRKGRWGESVGSKSWYDSALFHETWDIMKTSRKDREIIALDDAKKDLQRRIEICLYGTPRDMEIQLNPCAVRKS